MSLEERFQSEGGDLFERRTELETQKEHLSERLERETAGLSELAHGVAPLALVPDLIAAVQVQAKKERTAREAKAVSRLLSIRDTKLVNHLKADNLNAGIVQAVRTFLKQDRDAQRKKTHVEQYLMLDEESETLLSSVHGRRLSEAVTKSRKQLTEVEGLTGKLDTAMELIAAVSLSFPPAAVWPSDHFDAANLDPHLELAAPPPGF